jgi:hypothetical protein
MDGRVGWIDELIVDGLNGWNHGWVEWMDCMDCGWIHGLIILLHPINWLD